MKAARVLLTRVRGAASIDERQLERPRSQAGLQWTARRWNGSQAYSDSKLFDVMLASAVARR
jgi:hypothetical protein